MLLVLLFQWLYKIGTNNLEQFSEISHPIHTTKAYHPSNVAKEVINKNRNRTNINETNLGIVYWGHSLQMDI